MEFRDVVRARRMMRTYDPDRPVPAAVLDGLLDLAIRAPSAGFSQGWDFVVLRTAEDVTRFWTATAEPAEQPVSTADAPDTGGTAEESAETTLGPDRWLRGMQTAPVLILCLSDADRYLDRYAEPDKGWDDRDPARWPVPYWDVDTGMAGLLILLGAVDAGLGGCFFGVPPERQSAVLAEFGASTGHRIVGVISLGYPGPEGSDRRSPSLRRGRRPVTEVAHDGRFGTSWATDGAESPTS